MQLAILHNAVLGDRPPDETDVLVQVAAVQAALEKLNHETFIISCTLNLETLKEQLLDGSPDLVVNLVESLDQRGALIHLVPYLLESLQIPFTGAPAEAMLATSHKIMAKAAMRAAGLPTPDWIGPCSSRSNGSQQRKDFLTAQPHTWIIKSLWEHASVGLDDESLYTARSLADLETQMLRRAKDLGGACFAETFVDGREFNLSVLDSPMGPEVLPPAEIEFEGYAPDKPRIVGYRAKWDSHAEEYARTCRRFDFPNTDRPLISTLEQTALAAWRCFGLKGYARVDIRVDADQSPWILEVNANPCLSPDAGFAAALDRAGIGFSEAVRRILEAAKRPSQNSR